MEAILIKGKTTIAIGATLWLFRLAPPETVLINLKGNVAFPDFIDPSTQAEEHKGLDDSS